ncbi:MAG: hypothetical protein IK047_05850 [Clostridia bacterium]|nr:hypothetical protein [Clostridia bacterium]
MKKLIAIAVVAILSLTVLVACGGGNGSPTACAEAAVKAELSYDMGAVVDLVPDYLLDKIASSFGLSAGASRSDIIKAGNDYIDAWKELAGDEWEEPSFSGVSSELVEEIKKGDEGFDSKLESYISSLPSSAEGKFDKEKVESFAKVKVTATVDGKEDSETIDVIKYDGGWYMPTA